MRILLRQSFHLCAAVRRQRCSTALLTGVLCVLRSTYSGRCSPTSGKASNGAFVLLTILGNYFTTSGAQVTVSNRFQTRVLIRFCWLQVSGVACANTQHDALTPQNKLTCQLPPGTGSLKSVVVSKDSVFSAENQLLSYASPSIRAVSGCVDAYRTRPLAAPMLIVVCS